MDCGVKKDIQKAVAEFEVLLREQVARNERIRKSRESAESGKEEGRGVTIGLTAGDGIGPVIMKEARAVLEKLLAEELESGEVRLREIDGFTLENRLEKGQTVPDEVLAEMRQCDVLLKGPTTTPNASMNTKNLESANVYLRKTFDLYANVRPVSIPEEGIDWTFFRENTEGEYALGSRGIRIGDSLDVDFKVTTREGTLRIARAAFDFARANGKKRVSIVTKANIMKKTDGKFTAICHEVAADYPGITVDDYYIDIMTANLLKEPLREQFQVVLLPNLYGDIITDEAAQIQGGVGTAGSANVGDRYAMFEAVHGSAPRMIERGMGDYANPASIIKAAAMLLRHICRVDAAARLEKAMAECKVEVKSDGTAATAAQYADAVMALL